FDTTFNGGTSDVYVTKLNSAGNALLYSTFIGGSGVDEARSIAIDSAGNAYLAGYTTSANFPATPGAFDTTFNGGEEAFVAKLSAGGASLVYATYLGGSGNEQAYAIAIDGNGNAYTTGYTTSTNFPTTAGAIDASFNGVFDAFVAKVNAGGTSLVFSTYLG